MPANHDNGDGRRAASPGRKPLDCHPRRLGARVTLLLVASSLACGAVAEDGSDGEGLELGAARQALGMNGGMLPFWLGGVIPYCFQPSLAPGSPAPGSTAWNSTVQMVQAAMARYERLPHSSFDFQAQGDSLCTNWNDYIIGDEPDVLTIVVSYDEACTRFCGPTSIAGGQQVDGTCVNGGLAGPVVVDFGINYGGPYPRWDNPEAGIFHELAHAIGFEHEDKRRSGNECVDDPALGGGYSGGIAEAITVYDVFSVMAATYCHGEKTFSSIDMAGLSYVYPNAIADRLTVPFSFPLPGVVLTGAQESEEIEFTNRLAGVWAFHYEEAQWFRTDSTGTQGLNVAVGSTMTLGQLLEGNPERYLTARFYDEYGRQRNSPLSLIRRNSGLATALLRTSLPIL